MESNTKYLMAVFSLMLSLSWGIPYIVSESEERNTSWLMLAIVFLVLTLLLWLWIAREQQSAEEAAEEALDAAEKNIKKIEDATKTKVEIKSEPVGEPSDSDGDEGIDEAQPPSTVSQADLDDLETKAEDAKQGDPVAEKEVADASAAPQVAEDVEIQMDNKSADDSALAESHSTAVSSDEASQDVPAEAEDVDLTIIEGIGPKYAQILNDAGITTYAQIASMSEDDIVATVKAAGGRKSASMSTWAEQAKLAADGDWDGLAKLQDELSGGRR